MTRKKKKASEYRLTPAERKRYGGQQMRALGQVLRRDYDDTLLLFEFMSGPLDGEKHWFTEQEVKELGVENP